MLIDHDKAISQPAEKCISKSTLDGFDLKLWCFSEMLTMDKEVPMKLPDPVQWAARGRSVFPGH